jgi:WD40 repeat protein
MTEESLFLAALERTDPADQKAFLDQACAGDTELRRRIEVLLAAYAAGQDKLEPAAPDPVLTTPEARPPAPETIIAGRYKLLQRIGEGGMGEVWVAKQTEPVQRKVALKLIKPGMDSRQVLARFEAERQALALMDHPNIAKVLDGGLTADGRPFFVMELVNGLPLTKFCDDAKLTPKERLELFVPVCQAVQHAHQKGIVHRDLKPSNILVTLYDGKPVPKVIDFGVAKATGGKLTEESLSTQFGVVIGTLEYMAPEQAGFSALDVDTRADIYSLGVILYELLTGLRPFDGQRLRKAAGDEVMRIIREEEPPRPSRRLSTDASLPSLAAVRQTEPKRLMALLRGELDWVVMKCLEKDRNRRYETANGLARDLQRYLHDEPVEARPPSAGYRLRKLLRRHRGPVLAAVAMAVLLVLGSAVSIWQAVRASRAEGVAEERRGAAEQAERQAKDERDTAEKERRHAEENERQAMAEELTARRHLYGANINLTYPLWKEGQFNRVLDLLDRQRPQNTGGNDFRSFEWDYVRRRCHTDLYTCGHADIVYYTAFSPDGQQLFSAESKAVKVWDVRTGQAIHTLQAPTESLYGGAFSPDGRYLASASRDSTVKVWDVATGQTVRNLTGHTSTIARIVFSPDGQRIATAGYPSLDLTVRVWDAASGKELLTLRQDIPTNVYSLAFSPDGHRLGVAGTDRTARIWDADNGQLLLTLQGHTGPVRDVVFSQDGQLLATGSNDQTARIWDATSGKELRTLPRHTDWVFSVAFSPDGQRLATAGRDKTIRVWSRPDWGLQVTLQGHTDDVHHVTFSPDGWRLASASRDQTVKIWDAYHDNAELTFRGQSDEEFTCVAFSPDGQRLASAGTASVIKLWEAHTGQLLFSLHGHSHIVNGVAFSPDGKRLASASHDGTVKLWEAHTGRLLDTLRGHSGLVHRVVFSADGKWLASGSAGYDRAGQKLDPRQGEVKLWDAATGQEAAGFQGAVGAVYGLAFSPDSMHLAVAGSDRTVKVLTIPSGVVALPALPLKGEAGIVVTSRERVDGQSHPLFLQPLAYSPDGRQLAQVNSERGIKVWDAFNGREIFSVAGAGQRPRSDDVAVAFSPDGNRFIAADRSGMTFFDAHTGLEMQVPQLQLLERLPPLQRIGFQSVVFSPDGQQLALVTNRRYITVLDVRPLTPEIRAEREALNLLRYLLHVKLLSPEEVQESIRRDQTLNDAVRQKALALAQHYRGDAYELDWDTWAVVWKPGNTDDRYRLALRRIEAACRADPDSGERLNTLGVALYRVGQYQKALDTLLRADRLNSEAYSGSLSFDLAFIAMSHHQLGNREQAQVYLKRLRESIKEYPTRSDYRAWSRIFLREAETLIEGKPDEPSK